MKSKDERCERDQDLNSIYHVELNKMSIDKEVPLPQANRSHYPELSKRIESLFSQMAVGDSFFLSRQIIGVRLNSGRRSIESTVRNRISTLSRSYAQSHEEKSMFKIAIRKEGDGLRIWRVE